MKVPKISVIMSVFNGAPYLTEAVDSILSQSVEDFEFVIVDDCSTDGTLKALESITDQRVRIIRNDRNQGISSSLNKAVKATSGEFLARMDADDISVPTRFARQVKYLEDRPEVAVVGSWIRVFSDTEETLYEVRPPAAPALLKWMLFFSTPIKHPTAMIRRDAFLAVGGYDESLATAQDYDLWCRMAAAYDLSNIEGILLHYRHHPAAISLARRQEQRDAALEICIRQVREVIGEDLDLEQANALFGWRSDPRARRFVRAWLPGAAAKFVAGEKLDQASAELVTASVRERLRSLLRPRRYPIEALAILWAIAQFSRKDLASAGP